MGISAADIQWPVLGTQDRFTGAKTTTNRQGRRYTKATGNPVHHTGRMPAVLKGIVPAVAASSGDRILQAVREKVQKTIASEVHASQVPRLIH